MTAPKKRDPRFDAKIETYRDTAHAKRPRLDIEDVILEVDQAVRKRRALQLRKRMLKGVPPPPEIQAILDEIIEDAV